MLAMSQLLAASVICMQLDVTKYPCQYIGTIMDSNVTFFFSWNQFNTEWKVWLYMHLLIWKVMPKSFQRRHVVECSGAALFILESRKQFQFQFILAYLSSTMCMSAYQNSTLRQFFILLFGFRCVPFCHLFCKIIWIF